MTEDKIDRSGPRSSVIISGPDGVTMPEKPKPKRKRRRPATQIEHGKLRSAWNRAQRWWYDYEIDLSWPWIMVAEVAWLFLLAAQAAQPFTRALHLLWMAVLISIQAGALWWLARYVREYTGTPPTEVRPAEEA